ncbi:hypothetical protein EV210_12318 [Anaerospora hongkongensis]|uniref:Uncharacterized protein n=1 Tax=Anaerospora hongkongensis TaxID=244830 RepID=A0A4R1PP63_9FIRM|nr:hypothetical protein [Anaerospora hongkongensis]TCL32198.1 hypothetical protein EV210_12318 [Anaerospora hongkongensis]
MKKHLLASVLAVALASVCSTTEAANTINQAGIPSVITGINVNDKCLGIMNITNDPSCGAKAYSAVNTLATNPTQAIKDFGARFVDKFLQTNVLGNKTMDEGISLAIQEAFGHIGGSADDLASAVASLNSGVATEIPAVIGKGGDLINPETGTLGMLANGTALTANPASALGSVSGQYSTGEVIESTGTEQSMGQGNANIPNGGITEQEMSQIAGQLAFKLSDNSSFSVKIDGPQCVRAFGYIDPLNPLVRTNVTYSAGVFTFGPCVVWGAPVLNKSEWYAQATKAEKTFKFRYAELLPNKPPRKGTVTVIVRTLVNELNTFATANEQNGTEYNNNAYQSGLGFDTLDTLPQLSKETKEKDKGKVEPINGNDTGGQQAGQMDLNTIAEPTTTMQQLTAPQGFPNNNNSNKVSDNNTGLLNGVGSLLNSLGSYLGGGSINPGVVKQPGGLTVETPEAAKAAANSKQAIAALQSNKTPDDVRKENYKTMTPLFKDAAALLKQRGIDAASKEALAKQYQEGSAYTDLKHTWDMNRIDRFLN